MATKLECIYPIASALVALEDELGPNRNWQYINEQQNDFLDRFTDLRKIAPTLDCIESICSLDVNKVNQFLKEHGFDIQLEKMPGRTISAASILQIIGRWKEKGKNSEIIAKDNNTYDGIEIDKDVMIFHTESYGQVARLQLVNGYYVFMTLSDNVGFGDFVVIDRIRKIRDEMQPHSTNYRVVFPKIDINQMVDISWLVGMLTVDDNSLDWEIVQALQQSIFKMNHHGLSAKSAVAMMVKCLSFNPRPKDILVIDSPFILWIDKAGMEVPLFAGWFDYDSWKDPGTIEGVEE